MPKEGKAFLTGGCGCLVLFTLFAGLVVMAGGSAHMDIGGIFLLMIIGGVIGLIINWVYQMGKKDASHDDESKHHE